MGAFDFLIAVYMRTILALSIDATLKAVAVVTGVLKGYESMLGLKLLDP